jgi:hypothetical protein
MKDFLRQLLSGVENQILARQVMREYLQALLLQSLQDRGAFSAWLFQGGTALRFLYSIPRFSEELDFALIEPGVEDNFQENLDNAGKAFLAANYEISLKLKMMKTVKSAFVRFGGLLYEFGLSPLESETVSIKVEVDTNPPMGAGTDSTVVRRHVVLNLRHYDKASLLAGKLHAVMTRGYVKGRDVYDLIWYLSDRSWPSPNIELLRNALRQTNRAGPEVTAQNWRGLVCQRIDEFNWERVLEDVQPFLERPDDIALVTKENALRLLAE